MNEPAPRQPDTSPSLSLRDPATLLATWFGVGLLRPAPGSWGSLAALPLVLVLSWIGGPTAVLIGAGVVFVVGIWASDAAARKSGMKDPGAIVIDEVAGQMLTLAAAPIAPLPFLLGFCAFRFFDIVKPWPVSWADEKIGGGLGIMLDDVLAGIYAAVVVAVWVKALPNVFG